VHNYEDMTTDTAAASPLDAMLCFSLYTASHATTQAYRAVLKPWKLTYPQYLVLTLLGAQPRLTVSELGARMALDSGTLSPLLRRLETRGLVTRMRSTDDERVVTVSLTDAGQAIRTELTAAVACLAPAYGVDAAGASALLAQLHGVAAGMRDLVDAAR
jgi:DNA-binding MarR family transcriptional regulator